MYTAEASIETKLGDAQGWKDVLTAAGFRFRKAAKNLPDAVFFPLKDEKGKLRQCGDILRSLLGMLDHRIDTRPEVSLLCVLAWEKRPKFFTCYDAMLECTRHLVPMFVPMKNFRVHSRMASYDGVVSRQHVKFRTKYRLSDTSGLVSILWLDEEILLFKALDF
jgi:hypothetical protein